MASDLAVLRLHQLFDSQFPIGTFAQSGGIETYAALGMRPPALAELLRHQVELGWGKCDLAAACLAWEAGTNDMALGRLSAELDAWKVVPAQREASVRLGERTLRLIARLYPLAVRDLRPRAPHHAVIVGAVGRRLDIPKRELLLGFAQSALTASLAAATRCMPLSPGDAQAILTALHDDLAAAVACAIEDAEASFFACTPALDVRSHQQAFLRTRLFQS